MGETPFSLIYGAKVLIPMKVGEPTLWFSQTNEEANNEVLLVRLDLLEEHRDLVYMRMTTQKQRMERYYNWRVNLCYFKLRDLFLRKVTQSTQKVNAGKLGPTWECPYRVSAVTGKGLYELQNQDGLSCPAIGT
ncbi:uncharacterized protein [Nicotiana tomentosiformis]|uniref:uncharacterized protein n=1 Tax=Nicotiana tomentosiformis TaxID=4098 RepID=UPI00388CE933